MLWLRGFEISRDPGMRPPSIGRLRIRVPTTINYERKNASAFAMHSIDAKAAFLDRHCVH